MQELNVDNIMFSQVSLQNSFVSGAHMNYSLTTCNLLMRLMKLCFVAKNLRTAVEVHDVDCGGDGKICTVPPIPHQGFEGYETHKEEGRPMSKRGFYDAS